jgi:hypothetical protein
VPERYDRITDGLARDTSRRGFLARVGGALMALTAARTVGSLVEPGDSVAFHFCGHIFTTGSCPHPAGLPRIDSLGFPLRASDGHPIDDVGRPVNEAGQPVDDAVSFFGARTGVRFPRRRGAGFATGSRTSTGSGRPWTAPGTGAAGGRSASWSTAVLAIGRASTATRR